MAIKHHFEHFLASRQTDGRTDRQTDGRKDRPTDRHTDRRTERTNGGSFGGMIKQFIQIE